MAFPNKPFILPYNKEPTLKELSEKIGAFSRQLFFMDARVKELEAAYLEMIDDDDSGEDMVSDDSEDVSTMNEAEKKLKKK